MLSRNHPFFPQFKKLMGEAACNAPTYDLGTPSRFFKEAGLVKELFNPATYKAGGYKPDMNQGEANCDFDCDLHDLSPIANNIVGSVICLSVLEHVLNPQKALEEICRILKPGGIAIISVPFAYPYHGKTTSEKGLGIDSSHGSYGDLWRFTHEGLTFMCAKAGFSRVDIYPVDGRIILFLELVGLYNILKNIPFIGKFLSLLDKPRLGGLTTMHFIRAEK